MSWNIRELNPSIRRLSLCAGLAKVHLVLVDYITIWSNYSMSYRDRRSRSLALN